MICEYCGEDVMTKPNDCMVCLDYKLGPVKREYTFAGLFTVQQVKRIEALFMLMEEEE